MTPKPNVFHTYSVTISAPIKEVYTTLGTPAGHERVCRLSDLCSKVELLQKDVMRLDTDNTNTRLADGARIRVMDAVEESAGSGIEHDLITRQHFVMEETLSLLFGLYKPVATLKGTLSWKKAEMDQLLNGPEEDIIAASANGQIETLYETAANGNVITWKHRKFEVVEGDTSQTRVTERLEIESPTLLKPLVEQQATKAHRVHMDKYHTLFE